MSVAGQVCVMLVVAVSHIQGQDICGTQPGLVGSRHPRILQGEDARRGAWPWQGLLFKEGTLFCGAVLIQGSWALTSALCVRDIRPDFVRFGEHDVSEEGDGEKQERGVEKVVLHPDYQGRITENDMALIKMNSSVVFSATVSPICLPQEQVNLTSLPAWSTGWGTSSLGGGVQKSVLQQIEQEVLSSQECEDIYHQLGHDLSLPEGGYLCTMDREEDRSSCYGDGGGPVAVQRDDRRWEVVGIQSWGVGCGQSGQPNVATRVEAFLEWIEETLRS